MERKGSQKIIIPKGAINPDEETIIEIPYKMRKQPVVVARKDPNVNYSRRKKKYRDKETTTSWSNYDDDDHSHNRHRDREKRKIHTHEDYEKPCYFSDEKSRFDDSCPGSSQYQSTADDRNIEKLMEDLEKYYQSQKKVLLKAKQSQKSICSCSSKSEIHSIHSSRTNLPPCDLSAPPSQISVRDSEYRYRRETDKKSAASLGNPTNYISAPASCCSRERPYSTLLNSQKMFAVQAESLRRKLNAMEPYFKSTKEFQRKAECLRRRLKEMYESETELNDEICIDSKEYVTTTQTNNS